MDELLRQANNMPDDVAAATTTTTTTDNRLASVLHFLCTLVKDGELKAALTPYMADIFTVAIGTIESKEWTVRNAALQLFGAIVPKVVGQTQYFENSIDWLPVYIVYTDIVIKSHSMHQRIFELLRRCIRPSVLLVALLEFLSHIEVIGDTFNGEPTHTNQFRQRLFTYLRYDCEKIRTLAARCLARWHKFTEIPGFVCGVTHILCRSADENQRHGLTAVILACFKKYQSDVRYTQFDESEKLAETVRMIFITNWNSSGWTLTDCSYYLRIYLAEMLMFIGVDRMETIMLRICFNGETCEGWRSADVWRRINEMDCNDNKYFGFNQWKCKMLDLYDDDGEEMPI